MRSRTISALLVVALLDAFFSGSSLAQTCPANIPHLTGTWTVLPYQMPINPISANLLHNGKVLIVAGSENDATNNSKGAESYRAATWDPTGTTESSIAVQNLPYDVFCSGTAALPDGRSLIVGGTSDYTFTGESRASFFDPATGQFVQSQNMVDGRWYATATTLGDGRIMAMSGVTKSGATSRTVEIYDLRSAGTGWTAPISVPFTPPLYPRVELLPDGTAFYTGQGSGGNNASAWIFNPTSGTWTASAVSTRNRSYGSSVLLPLLPPNYVPRVMNFGGGSPATATTEIIDLSAASPSWTPGPNMSTGRIQMHAVILPNGKVLAEGGSVSNESPDTPGKTADLYDPVSKTMSSAGTAAYSRLYHSTALLLPDATVVSMGSNPGKHGSYEPATEIYTPAYLYDANDHLITTNRPHITALSSSGPIDYNTAFRVSYSSTSPISSAVLVRPGSSTHASNMDQRLIGLCGATSPCSVSNNTLNLTTPPNGNIAPPGYYMLFLLDSAGVPSVAQFIELTPYSTVAPRGTIGSPTANVAITAGGIVNFMSSTTGVAYSWVFPGGTPATSTAQNPGNVMFSTPGTYQASLTVIDSSGNSDPSPPTRTITVLPTTPDFSITVGPPEQQVVPGGFATYTVTVRPLSGFAGTVNLSVSSESGFPTGITSGGFNPASINGSGSSTLTMTTTTLAIPSALSLTITGTSGTLTHTASTTLLVNLAPPASLSASRSDTKVSLSWPASVGATSYHLKRAKVSGGPYLTFACPASTSYVDTGLVDDSTYFYVVSGAFSAGNPNAGGESADSVEASATPRPAVPPTPAGLVATAGNGQVTLTWNASSGATSYQVKRATVSHGPYTVIASPTSPSYTNTGLTTGTTYYYVVSAVNSGGKSADSVEASATPRPAVPPTPAGLVATAGNGQVTLTWNASSGATSYQVKRATVSHGPYTVIASPTSPSYTNTGLTTGTTYYYVVSAVNSGGKSADSVEASATPRPAVPPTPAGLVATAGNGQVSLTWNASAGATSYQVKRATVSHGPYTVIASPSSPSYTNTGLTTGTTYYYVVSAVNLGGKSADSVEASATPHVATPHVAPPHVAPPTNLTAKAAGKAIKLRWVRSTTPGVTSNGIYRRLMSGGTYPSSPTVTVSATTSYHDRTVSLHTSYCYMVTAITVHGQSAHSDEACATAK